MNLTVMFAHAFKGTKAVAVITRHEEATVEVYHYSACICKVKASGEIILDNGGYYTKTTKRHLNTCLEILGIGNYIYQKNFDWYFSNGQEFTRHCQVTK